MKKTTVTDTQLLGDLLFGPARTLGGSTLGDDELVRLARETFKENNFCVVRNWMLLDVMVPPSIEQKIQAQGLEPTLLYAQVTVFDSTGSFHAGASVVSGYQRDFDGCIFESQNTIFILGGRGSRKHAGWPAVQALAAYENEQRIL
ncbi:hypothetical protein [Pseudomonas sp. 008]|jgi:hypothetical protein|uniref:DUF6957 family protein n=1 Tax=Pseudomonas sp. 008 TaxID=2803906 RepID=UPI00194DD59B|nr:hypothetical protein [Pseudomonas sp. 008]